MADIGDLTQNVSLHNDSTDAAVTTTTDGAKELLDVNVETGNISVTSDDSPTKYQLQSDFDATGVALNTSTDTTIYTYSGDGVLDFVAVTGGNSNFEVTLKMDGTERIRITMAELAAIGLSNATNVEVWAETANKNFRYHPHSPLGFATSFTILAKATGAPIPTVTHLVLFREKVA